MNAVGPEFGFGLYIHWPYCARICPYCDFNVYAAKDRESDPLVQAIVDDIRAHRSTLPEHPPLDSVFFGGGTPSLLSPAQMERILTAAQASFGLKTDAEISLEANPNDVLSGAPSDWALAGINRLSLGIQSLDDQALAFLGRDHNGKDARAAVERTQKHFDNHSVDLIYARPGQTAEAWQQELTDTLALGAPHLSLYELTIEERTAFGKRAARGDLVPMEDDDQADLYDLTQEVCEAHGLPAYEVSNHARTDAFQSRHNHIYWASGDWIGVGPGAHGRLTINGHRMATEAKKRPADYLEVQKPDQNKLSQHDTATEFLAMALRPTSGVDLERFETLFGVPVDTDVLSNLSEQKLARQEGQKLHLTQSGRLMADYIASLLVPY
ncbi:MAG: radical SAM family heme chaperone HemW [Henriciella sp.]|nr:radical SAM family heme chaperone HemW [Henriciella sp.]